MIFKPKSIIGIDIEDDAIIACEVTKRGTKVGLSNYKSVAKLTELTDGYAFKEHSVVISVPTQLLLFRSFIAGPAVLKAKDQKKAIAVFLERQSLPLKLNDCFWGTFILNGNLNLVAARKEVVEKYLTPVRENRLKYLGVIPSFCALYNLLVYNYGYQEKFNLLNIRNTSCDILIFENKKFWIYPLPMGRQNLEDNPQELATIIEELYRTFNTHYLQNPSAGPKLPNRLYLSGISINEELISSFKKTLVDYEIIKLEPLKKVAVLRKMPPQPLEKMALSLGLGITFLRMPQGIDINLIKETIKKEQVSTRLNSLIKVANYAAVTVAFLFIFFNAKLGIELKGQRSQFKHTQALVSSALPEIKVLKEERKKLQSLEGFLGQRLSQQALYLKALGVVSDSKSALVEIKELEATAKEARIEVFLSGKASSYEEINNFLANLKKNQDVKDVKVVASTFPDGQQQASAVEVKLRFEIE